MHPILLNTNLSSANRFRPKINAFAWTWGSEPAGTPTYYVSGITQNWLPSSNDLTQTVVWPTPSGGFSVYSATEISGPSGMSAFGITFSGSGSKFGNQRYTYSNFVTAGITYTFSMYINVTAGLTQAFNIRIGDHFAINSGSPYSPRLQQIQPVVRPATTIESSYIIGFSAGSSGWTRIVVNVTPQLTQRLQIASFQINGIVSPPTKPYYIAGLNFNEGILPTDFVSTNIVPEIEDNQYGNTGQSVIYDGSVSSYLNFGPDNGLTYIHPLPDAYSALYINKSWLSPTSKIKWRESQSLKRYVSVLKGLTAGNRAIYPRYISSTWLWGLDTDKFELGATGGIALTFFDDNGGSIVRPLCGNTYHGGLWIVNGICLGQNIWDQVLLDISSQDAYCDYFIHNQEVVNNYHSSFSIFDCTANNLSVRNAIINNPKYNQEFFGLTSWASHMAANGACAYTVQNTVYDPALSYLSWDMYGESLIRKAIDVIVSSSSTYANGRFANSIQTDAYSFDGDGTPLDGPPAIFGFHPYNSTYVMGNAPSPILYGWYYNGWNTSVIYGTNMDKIKFSLSVGAGETRPSQYPIAWMPFLFDMQRLRLAKRGSPNLPIIPVIPSLRFVGNAMLLPGQTASDLTKTFAEGVTATEPVCWFADVNVGYNPQCGITFTQFGGNSAYFYELIRHACVSGAKGFDWWNNSSFWNAQAYGACYGNSFSVMNPPVNYVDYIKTGDTTYLQDMKYLNNVLDDCNRQIGGYTPVTYNTSRINYLTDSVISGAPGITSGTVWRATIKPGTIFEYPDSALNPSKVLSGSCVGAWITTSTRTPPVVQPQTLKDTFYVIGPSSTDGSMVAQGNGTTYGKWFALNRDVVITFQGLPYTGNATGVPLARGRAYDFEFNPVNPQVSSPWHNVFYELCWDAYNWGARSFYLSYPLGQIPYLAYPFKDVVNRERKVYTSSTDAAYCPARWKGFTSAIKGLLEGTLNPAGACAAKAGLGFTAMTEGCNVMMYFQSTSGYWENRFGNTGAGPNGLTFYEGSLKLWDDCFASAGTCQGADALYYSYVDQFVNEIISIKSNLGTAGSLSCGFDATVDSATPGTIGIFQQLPSYYTRGNSYELTDWYIQERLRMAGIQCYVEARTPKYMNPRGTGITGAGWDSLGSGDSLLRFVSTATIRFNNKNLLMDSENFAYPQAWQRGTNARVSGPTYGPTPISTTNANLITFTQQNSVIYQVPTTGQQTGLSAGNTCTLSMWIKRVSGNTALHLYHFNSGSINNFTPVTVTNDWVRYSTSFVPSTTIIEAGIQDRNPSGFGSVLVWGAQLEAGSSATSYQATTGKHDWKNWLAVEYNVWYQNPRNPVLGSTQDGNYSGYLPDEETPTCFRWTQNTGPIPPARDPYQVPNTISTGGVSYTLPFGFATWYDSPLKYLTDLYAASDVYRKFNNLANTGLTFSGVVYDQPTKGYIMRYGDYARGSCGNLEILGASSYSSLTGYYRFSTELQQQGNMIGYAAPYTKAFDANGFANGGGSGASYAANGACGFWQLSSVTFWRENVKQPTFDGFLNMLRQVSLTGCPPYGNTAGWSGATYPNDFYGLNIIPKSMRP